MSDYGSQPVEISTRMRPGEWSEETLEALVSRYREQVEEMGASPEDVTTTVDRDDDGGVSVIVAWDRPITSEG